MPKLYKYLVLAWCVVGAPVYAQTNAVTVDVFYPESSQSNQMLKLTGTVQAVQQSQLASLEAGVVAELYAEVGDSVSRGQKLLALDDTLAKLTLAQDQASLNSAQVARDEAERLYKEVIALSESQVAAETLISERRAALAATEAALARQKSSLALQQEVVSRHVLKAPFDGVIARRNADVGEWVTQQSQVYELVQDNALRLVIAIPQEYYAQLAGQIGSQVRVQPDFVSAQASTLKLDRLVPVSDSQNRTMTAHVYLPAATKLVAGMSASAEIQLPMQQEDMIWLPRTALKLHPDGGASVFAVIDNRAKRVLVDVVQRRQNQVAVSNASAQLGYVVSGVELLQDGSALVVSSSGG